jgi:hypothetical protein
LKIDISANGGLLSRIFGMTGVSSFSEYVGCWIHAGFKPLTQLELKAPDNVI